MSTSPKYGKRSDPPMRVTDPYGRNGRRCRNRLDGNRNRCKNIAAPDSHYCTKCSIEFPNLNKPLAIDKPKTRVVEFLSTAGRYDAYLDADLAAQLERLEQGDVFDLRPEVALLRLMLINYINILSETSSSDDGKPRQLKKPDLNGISALISSISVVLERIEKRESKTSMTLERFSEIWDVMATVVVEVLQDMIVDDFARNGILDRIKSRWGLIKL